MFIKSSFGYLITAWYCFCLLLAKHGDNLQDKLTFFLKHAITPTHLHHHVNKEYIRKIIIIFCLIAFVFGFVNVNCSVEC